MSEIYIVCSKCGQKLIERDVYNGKKVSEELKQNWIEINVLPCEYCLEKEINRITDIIKPIYELSVKFKERIELEYKNITLLR